MRTSGPDSPDEGARTPVWLATNPDMGSHTGGYYVRMGQVSDRFAGDEQEQERLYEICSLY